MPDLKAELIKKISVSVSPEAARIWLDDCSFIGLRNGRIEFEASSDFKRKMMETRLKKAIVKALNELTEKEYQVFFSVSKKKNKTGKIRDHYSFKDFVKGKDNEFALATILASTDHPSEKLPHPVYIYGGEKLGKTHLLRSAEKRISDNAPERKAVYIKAEELVELFGPPKADFIFIDDFFQDRSGKLQLYLKQALDTGANVIAAGKLPPSENPDTVDFLLPGTDIVCTPADIQPPDMETRQAINTVTALRNGTIM